PGRSGGARDEYELTARGETLWPVVWSLIVWGNDNYMPTGSRRIATHEPCGTPLDSLGFCATCQVTPGARDVVLPARDAGAATDPVSLAMTRPHRLLEPLAV
ncbi:MAG TPA: transcriptional regulator, partial [Galbitalea sp.]